MNFLKRLFGIKEEKDNSVFPKPYVEEKKTRSTSIDGIIKGEEHTTEKIVSGMDVENTSPKKVPDGYRDQKTIVPEKNIPMSDPNDWSDFEKDGKYGYEDDNGNVMIEAKFDEADIFENGIATVKIGELHGLINAKGDYILQPIYDFIYPETDGMILIQKGDLMGFALRDGTIKIPIQYMMAHEFSDGIAAVMNGDHYGYIDKEQNTVLPFKFEDAGPFNEGLAYASIDKNPNGADDDIFEEGYGFIDRQGNFVIEPNYERAGTFRQGLAPVRLNEKWGYINKQGEKAGEFLYESVNEFYQGRASVRLVKDGKWGFVDRNGKLVIDYQFDYGSDFMDIGTAYVFIKGKCFTLSPDGSMKK
jgi:hypothetical protein